ncbi:hypothetical protein GCM10023219_13450 [Stakelama sediminis]|uniref:Curlin associated repeat-containing protein n=1 Tax=Stakelama sediminis TaxID=463200 RepID=A0A840YWY9_9SPHN|nr:hypothetical protein [Stakelama sediminis]MBB5718070.1 hypothetical protein [Stakelama sediminis]
MRTKIVTTTCLAFAIAHAPLHAQTNGGTTTVSGGQQAQTLEVPRPDVVRNTAYIAQIGDGNRATILQSATNADASIRQTGNRNVAQVAQQQDAASYADLKQDGDDNDAGVTQQGSVGNAAYLTQTGDRNIARATQTSGAAGENGAILMQQGSDNLMALTQDGGDNQALLTQTGDGNSMTARQENGANRLIWQQTGNNLSDLQITQSGGAAMQITQSN